MTASLATGRGESPDPTAGATPDNKLVLWAVWAVWGGMLGAVLACIVVYGVDLPILDDWEMVPVLTGNEPRFFAWLWSQWAEHRLPLPRLILFAVLKLSGGDFRAGMIVNTLIVATITAAMMLAARDARGRTSIADAFFPLLMLHLGQSYNLLWSWGMHFVSSVALTIVLLVVIVRQEGALRPWPAAIVAAAILLLPLTGAGGLMMVVALTPWLLASAWLGSRTRRPHEPSWPIAILWIAVLGAAVEGLLYVVGYEEQEPWASGRATVLVALKAAAQLLAYAFGPYAARSWTTSVLCVAAVLLPSAALAVIAVKGTEGAARVRALGLCAFGAGMLVLVLAIGWGRGAFGLHYRYVLLTTPALCWAYFLWELHGKPVPRRVVQWALFLGLAAVLPQNSYWWGVWLADWKATHAAAVLRDIDAGLTSEALADRHAHLLLPWDRRQLVERIDMLRAARIGPWARVTGP